MSIFDIKTSIIKKLQEKYTGKTTDPAIRSMLKAEVSSILASAQKNGEIKAYSGVSATVRDLIATIRAELYPTFPGALIKFNFPVKL